MAQFICVYRPQQAIPQYSSAVRVGLGETDRGELSQKDNQQYVATSSGLIAVAFLVMCVGSGDDDNLSASFNILRWRETARTVGLDCFTMCTGLLETMPGSLRRYPRLFLQ